MHFDESRRHRYRIILKHHGQQPDFSDLWPEPTRLEAPMMQLFTHLASSAYVSHFSKLCLPYTTSATLRSSLEEAISELLVHT